MNTEGKTIYVSGYDKRLAFEDLENYMSKFGKIIKLHRQFDQKGRSKGFVFIEYEDKESAERAVDDSGRANILGKKLTINYKIGK